MPAAPPPRLRPPSKLPRRARVCSSSTRTPQPPTSWFATSSCRRSSRARRSPSPPFVERLRDLYERAGISTIIVAGSSGAFFSVADTVIQMDSLHAARYHRTRARGLLDARGETRRRRPRFAMPREPRYVSTPPHPLVWKTASIAKRENAERRETRASPTPPSALR